MSTEEINWGDNCLTSGVHHGRPEALWNLPLLQATHMFTPEQLKELVVDRIYNDAMEWVEHGNEPRLPQAWAERVKELAEPMVLSTYYEKIEEISDYYRSPMFKRDVNFAIEFNKAGKLNSGYQPTHSHDTINLLCRIVGSSASRQASEEFPS
ncbi:MAG: hypothetical protein ACJ8BW_01975 [Ktedonobacteraceae bacterium]|jgi:hypothetical protein